MAGQDLPPEMEAPDFGWQLARQVAVCGWQARLPAEDAFFWIRLAAEEPALAGGAGAAENDPCRRALGLARELQERPLARLLMQAALLTREVGIGQVAAFLSLDPRVVAAYATLFFNMPGRADEDASKQQAARRFVTDCDNFASVRSGQGLAERCGGHPNSPWASCGACWDSCRR